MSESERKHLSIVEPAGKNGAAGKSSSAKTAKDANPSEILLQYGNLQNEIVKFNQTLLLNKRQRTDLSILALLFILSPFIINEWVYTIVRMTNPDALLAIGQWLYSTTNCTIPMPPEQIVENVRIFWDFAVGGVLFILLSYYLVFQSFRSYQAGFFGPTHFGVGVEGIRPHWNNPFWSLTGRLWRWEEIKGVMLRQKKNKSGQVLKSLEIRNDRGNKRRIDLRRFRREQDREFLARALQMFLPQANQAFEVREITMLDDCDPSYTKLWTQSLLTPPTRERIATLEPGVELADGRFIVKMRIGGGGQGTAYLAEAHCDAAFSETVTEVVLKEYVLPDPKNMLDRRRALKKLEHEVALLGRLSHKGIASFVDVFVEDHRAYLVAEYVDGKSLRQLVADEGPLAPERAVELALQLCEILEYLHGLEPPVVHQDFTPENLILSSDGTIKLVDFNVAKESITIKTGLVVGKQAYMPPEQFKGKASPQSDVFALGGTLYYLLTGCDPEPLTSLNPRKLSQSCPEYLDEIVNTATALDLESRYKSAHELRSALDEKAGGERLSIKECMKEPVA